MVVLIPVGLVVVFHVIDLVHSVSYAGEAHRHRLRESRVLRSLETNILVGAWGMGIQEDSSANLDS